MSVSGGDYRPRDAEQGVLYRVIDEHLYSFLETARRQADGAPLPAFVEQEFRDFLTCGVLAHGFARLRSTGGALERLVPFSCKGRGLCPSCGGRRTTECAARLVDEVLPRVPVRQWVLSLPYRLRYLLAAFFTSGGPDYPVIPRTWLTTRCRIPPGLPRPYCDDVGRDGPRVTRRS